MAGVDIENILRILVQGGADIRLGIHSMTQQMAYVFYNGFAKENGSTCLYQDLDGKWQLVGRYSEKGHEMFLGNRGFTDYAGDLVAESYYINRNYQPTKPETVDFGSWERLYVAYDFIEVREKVVREYVDKNSGRKI